PCRARASSRVSVLILDFASSTSCRKPFLSFMACLPFSTDVVASPHSTPWRRQPTLWPGCYTFVAFHPERPKETAVLVPATPTQAAAIVRAMKCVATGDAATDDRPGGLKPIE